MRRLIGALALALRRGQLRCLQWQLDLAVAGVAGYGALGPMSQRAAALRARIRRLEARHAER